MEYQQDPLQEQLNILKKLEKPAFSETKSSLICSIIFNLIVWLFLILIIISRTKGLGNEYEENTTFIILLIYGSFSYSIYLSIELFCSTTFINLITKDDKIKEKIGDFFKTKPSLSLYICCYHYDGYHRGGGPNIVYTFKKEIKYDYNFWRDISGIIKLNIDENKNKYYVNLVVNQEVIFIDTETLNDYNSYK